MFKTHLHVHNGNGVAPIADNNVVGVLGENMHRVDRQVHGRRTGEGFEGVDAFGGFHAPDFYGSVRRGTEKRNKRYSPNISTICGLSDIVTPPVAPPPAILTPPVPYCRDVVTVAKFKSIISV